MSNRRDFLKGLVGAAALVPFAGKLIVNDPLVPKELIVAGRQELVLPKDQPLIIAKELPTTENVKPARMVKARVHSMELTSGYDYDDIIPKYGFSLNDIPATLEPRISAKAEIEFVFDSNEDFNMLLSTVRGYHDIHDVRSTRPLPYINVYFPRG
jgi:hypothetical protein